MGNDIVKSVGLIERAGSTTRCSDFDTRGKEGQKEQKNEQEEI